MAVNLAKERYSNKVNQVTLGATKDQGGTRSHTITVGGESALPFLHFEGEMVNRPVVAMEVWNVAPEAWNECFNEYFADVYGDIGAWAKKCVDEYKADLIQVRLMGADPDLGDDGVDKCVADVKKVLEAVEVPLIVIGCGKEDKDNAILPAIAEAAAGENLLMGVAEQENYKSVTAACMVHKHAIIAQSPIDINICKQLNILISEMNLPMDRIIIDPTTAALGYGIEYGYSIMERARMGALQGDKMLSMPLIGNIASETWKTKESNAGVDEYPAWGEQVDRGILWETTTSVALLQAGMDILVLRHPKSVELVKNNIEDLMKSNSYA